jgi:CBS-domain-containing membrane protein
VVAPSANTATTAPAGDPLAAAARSGLGFPAAPLAGIVVILVGLCFCFLWIRRRRGQNEA